MSVDVARQIRTGRRTMCRVPVRDEDYSPFGWWSCQFKVGRAYAVQPGRGRSSSCRITVLDVRRELLGDISWDDCKREGCATPTEFRESWEARHRGWNPEQQVWVIAFRLGDFTERSERRLLARQPGPPSGDYTAEPSLALVGEAEAIPAVLQEQYSRVARERDLEVMAERRRVGSLADELESGMVLSGRERRTVLVHVSEAERAMRRAA